MIFRRKGDKNKYNFHDAKCIGRECWAPGMYAAPVNAACCLTRLRYGCDEGQRVYTCPQCDGKPDIEIGFLPMFDPELAKDRKALGWRSA